MNVCLKQVLQRHKRHESQNCSWQADSLHFEAALRCRYSLATVHTQAEDAELRLLFATQLEENIQLLR